MDLSDYESSFLEEIINIPSVGGTPTENAPYGEIPLKVLNTFLAYAEKAGFKTGKQDNKVGWVEFGSGDKLFGIICHLDVVPAGDGWTTDPFKLTIKDGAFYGRGIVDDKGPACASFFAMKRLLEEGYMPDTRIRLILGTDEERTCSCVEHYAEHCEVPFFAITPDAEFPAIFAEKGILHVEVSNPEHNTNGIVINGGAASNMVAPSAKAVFADGTTFLATGKMAHASKPSLGINAIKLLAKDILSSDVDTSSLPILKYINDFDDSFTGIDFEDVSGKVTTNLGILNVDDNTESLIIDIRYPITAEFDKIMDSLKTTAAKYGLEVNVDGHMGPLYKDKNSDEIRTLTSVWEKHMDKFDGFKEEYRTLYNEPTAIGGGTYARHIPNTIAFGIQAPWQEDQCHQADEHLAIKDFEELIIMIKEVIESI